MLSPSHNIEKVLISDKSKGRKRRSLSEGDSGVAGECKNSEAGAETLSEKELSFRETQESLLHALCLDLETRGHSEDIAKLDTCGTPLQE